MSFLPIAAFARRAQTHKPLADHAILSGVRALAGHFGAIPIALFLLSYYCRIAVVLYS